MLGEKGVSLIDSVLFGWNQGRIFNHFEHRRCEIPICASCSCVCNIAERWTLFTLADLYTPSYFSSTPPPPPPPRQLITALPRTPTTPPSSSFLRKELITILGISGQRYSQWTARSNYLPDCYWELWLGAVTMSNRQQVEAKESWDKGLWSLGKWGRCPLSLSACFSLSTWKWIKYRTQSASLFLPLCCVFSYTPMKKIKRLSLASTLPLFSAVFHTSRFVSLFSVP